VTPEQTKTVTNTKNLEAELWTEILAAEHTWANAVTQGREKLRQQIIELAKKYGHSEQDLTARGVIGRRIPPTPGGEGDPTFLADL
jgi:hypothetical protein